MSKDSDWLDHLHVSSKVFSQARADEGLPSWGVIWGFPDDVPGAIVMFHQANFLIYFLVMFEDLDWQGDGYYIDQSKAKVIRLTPEKRYILVNTNLTVNEYIRCFNRSRVPLRTCYQYV